MTPSSRILHGDCLEVLRTLPESSVHCVVTSPPYWSLRDYGVPPSVWGGDPSCSHEWESAGSREGYTSKKKWQHSTNGRGEENDDARALSRKDNPDGWNQIEQGKFCKTCGAWLGCLGLEPTPELYVEHLVAVFEEVRRVLRRDGTLWLNIGDSYMTDASGSATVDPKYVNGRDRNARTPNRGRLPGLKHKDMVGIPWRVAFALQASGWYLRSDVIWAKTNPMPESIADRPTKSHEYVFLLAKSGEYFFDAHAIREPAMYGNHPRTEIGPVESHVPGKRPHKGLRLTAHKSAGRNRRSVWMIPTRPFKGAHFATFPPRLVEPCILAGTSKHGCCSFCGAPYRRILEKGRPLEDQRAACGGDINGEYHGEATKNYTAAGAQNPSAVKARILAGMVERVTVGWRPTCSHRLFPIEPCVVLDPFAGTGTTGMVAAKHGRAFVGVELNPAYIDIAASRVASGAQS